MITGAGKTGSRIFFQSAASKKLERTSEPENYTMLTRRGRRP